MSKAQRIETGYYPRQHQLILHNELKRFNVLVCHRRFGKTVFSVNETIDRALRNPLKNPQYAYVAPNYGQAKRIAWDMFKDYLRDFPTLEKNEQELRIDILRPDKRDRLRFMLLGAENPASIRGIYLDGVIMDEYAEMDPTAWSQVIRPALSDRLGWAVFIGTPKGQNHFYDILQVAKKNSEKDWYHKIYKASETNVVPQSELEAAKATMSQEEYEQEFECSFSAALVGSYYGKQIEDLAKNNRITRVPHDPAVPVDTAWDLGMGDSTCIWFCQQVGKEIHIIDYIEESGQELAWYAKTLKEGHRSKYNYRDHLLPHDAKARSLETGRTRQQTLQNLGIRGYILPKDSVDDGINAARLLLPKCWFDEEKCEKGLNALRNYERKWDSKNRIFSPKPLHNWASHGADAFRYLAMGLKEDSRRFENKNISFIADHDYDVLNY